MTAKPQGPHTVASSASTVHTMEPIGRVVHRVLVVGLLVSVALMAFGLLLSAARAAGVPSGVVSIVDLPQGLLDLEGAAFLSLGLIVLIATPFVRVVGSLIAFARERDLRYVAITATVLAVMCVSVLIGRG